MREFLFLQTLSSRVCLASASVPACLIPELFFADPVFAGRFGVRVRSGEFDSRGRFAPCFGVDGAALPDECEVAFLWFGVCGRL